MNIPDIAHVRQHLIAKPGEPFSLAARPTRDEAIFDDKEDAKTSLKKDAAVINELKDMLYAHKKQSVLVVLQGMDTSGKSGRRSRRRARMNWLATISGASTMPCRRRAMWASLTGPIMKMCWW